MDGDQNGGIGDLQQFTVSQLADAFGDSVPVETAIRPLDSQFRICGSALTVECTPGDNLTLHHALHLARAGDALVVTGSANADAALWGELMSISAHLKGLAGTIVDGAVRDILEIRDIGYPVFSRHVTPRRAAKATYGKINVPVRIGLITVKPGDLIVADANGIVSIPRQKLDEAVQRGQRIANEESSIKSEILAGRTTFEILNLQPYVNES